MFTSETRVSWLKCVPVVLALTLLSPANAKSSADNTPTPHSIDVVIALDVSSSMDGLIDSAKQRLWDIVNELGRAQPQPHLRMAIISYGNPAYGAQSGFVRVDLPFTDDLDAVNKTLFEFQTNGGDEYVARAIDTALNKLTWSSESGALRVLFIAGNEAANQDPQLPVQIAARAAANQGVAINMIYCGNEADGDASGWKGVALATNGIYASIDQNAAAVANIATPMDQQLAALNEELNETFLAFGSDGDEFKSNQIEQDGNVATMSAPAMASRVATKASSVYKSESWDLVAAIESGKSLDEIVVDELPEEMREMEIEDRQKFVAKKARQREEISGRIQALADERRDYISKERAGRANDGAKGLDEVMQQGLQALAVEKGFTF